MGVATRSPTPVRNPSIRDPRNSATNRPPLVPSENASTTTSSTSRRPRMKEVTSRYLSSYSSSTSTSTSNSSSTTTTSSSSSSGSSANSSSRRFPSPLVSSRSSQALSRPSPGPKRSLSVDRARPATPKSDPRHRESVGNNVASSEMSSAARVLCTAARPLSTRSLSVSFQGGSFFYQTTAKAKAEAPCPTRKPTPERRKSGITPERKRIGVGSCGDGDLQHVENSRPADKHRWPSSRMKQGESMLTRSMDCSLEKNQRMIAAVKSLQQPMAFEDGITHRMSFDGSVSSDTESVSSESNYSTGKDSNGLVHNYRSCSRGESKSRLHRGFTEQVSTNPAMLPRGGVKSPQNLHPTKKLFMPGPVSSPRSVSSPLRGHIRPLSPSKAFGHTPLPSPSRAMSSPLRSRDSSGMAVGSSSIGRPGPGPAPSIVTFASEVRRTKNGESKIEEAHLLRLLYNRHLQWCCVNARVDASMAMQRLIAEKNLYSAWVALSELHTSVTTKKIKLHILTQTFKLSFVLGKQMVYLGEWSHMDRDHSTSLSGAIDALKASTLRLPVVEAKADIQNVKETINSAVYAMQAMESSIRSLLLKVDGANSLVSELNKVSIQEQALLAQARDLLSMVAAIHVKLCSLRGHNVQLNRNQS
ncbi:hypothetical protein ZOSMA_222G00100 [Zostera marina]|uniref:QWRF motif-containing protein 2 n=1 Tax=Zostera marina TaxID=29655 RepID=A0A0K9PLF2_ZOSMR|nr:hypothetical protein ZOSMA_222G00100 [Zostera marina]